MGRPGKKTKIAVNPAKEMSEFMADDLPAVMVPAGVADLKNSFDEEDHFLDGRKIEEIRKLKIQNDILAAQLTKLNNDNQSRVLFSNKIFWIVIGWLFIVITVFVLAGFKIFTFSDNVLITLLATTTVNIIGLFVIVANYLFNKTMST